MPTKKLADAAAACCHLLPLPPLLLSRMDRT